MFQKEVYISRRKKLIEKINDGIILILGNADVPMNYLDNPYHFRQDSNFLYFFGLDFQNLAGVIDVESGQETIFGNDVDIEDIIWLGPQIGLSEKAENAGVENTAPFKELFTVVGEAIAKRRKIHFLPPYRAENKILLEELTGISSFRQKQYASLELIKAIVTLRSIKEPREIEEMRKACNAAYHMHVSVMKKAKEGISEQEIAGIIEGVSFSHGGSPSFPIILSQSGEILHNHDHSQLLKNGRLLLVDAGAESKMHYASDLTRTTPVGGKFSQKQGEIYEIVVAANAKARQLAAPGITYLSVHLAVAEVIASGLKNLGLMKGDVKEAVKSGAHAMFFPHGLGHMIGLDVHDMEDLGQVYVGYDDEIRPADQFGTAYLRLGRRLQPGFVITNEPGIYFIPALIEKWKTEKINHDFINFGKVEEYIGFGGIRLEDNMLITDLGCEVLSKNVPITPDEVENMMQ